ncbi:MAG: adenylate/guanylate cyclase domain-containing protein [Acidimicrobiales bacterium]
MGNAPGELGLAPYVPRLVLEWDLDPAGERWRALEATCCFVDISGFTALSERLARRGRIGAEELTEVLNLVFSRMLEVAYAKGGALLKFGGDALLLAFTGDDHATMAAQGAVAMRAALREARTVPTSVGRVNLLMSVGIHSGTFLLSRVGATHHELLITGPAATATTRMEQTADASEIVISAATADRLPAGAVGGAKGEGRLLRWRHVVDGGPGPIPPRPVSSAAVAACVPVALRTRLGQRGGESEHRVASVAFVKFQGVDDLLASDGPDRTAAALDTVVRTVQDAADSESVTFLASDIDANGGKIILITGVPATLEDDEGRLLRAARRIAEAPHPLPVRIGVNRGHVFAGDIGTAYRRTFTVMGDTVNLAARLMAAAQPGEILATAGVLDRGRTQFAIDALEPFSVKGKSEPVQAFRVGRAVGSRADSFGALPFRGREKESATLLDALGSAATGRGRTVLVDAERGVGKTRLINEFAASAPPGPVLWLQGEPHRVGDPYQPLRTALRAVLGIEARDREDAGRQLVTALAGLDGGLLPFAPLLAAVVDADVPSTPESDAVAEEFARSRIADLVVSTLDAACPTPLLIVAEDAHWFDDTTSDICGRLSAAAASRPWLLCVTRRPEAAGGFTPSDPETRLPLALLSDDVARELVDVATETAPLRPHERDAVVARAGGNPLFLEELLRIVRATEVESLPDTLDAVAMREIDALATSPRRVLRLASVLGRSFDRRLLGQLLAAESVETGADLLADLRTQLVPDGDGEQIRFRHALLQEAAYQSLPFRQRLELHRKVGEALEGDTADPDAVAPLLSLHFLSAQDWDRTWRYARVAARVAQQAHAHSEVVVHLDRAVVAGRRLGTVDDEERAPVFSELGHALELLGEYERADVAYRNAGAATRDPLQRGEITCRRAYLRTEFLGRPSAAIRQLRAARAELDTHGDRAAGLRALLLAEESDARLRQGRLAETMACAARAAHEAELAGEKGALALSLHARSVCLVRMGRAEEAHDMARVLELYEELGDDVKVAGTLGNIATVAFFASQWDVAAHYVGLSIEAFTKVGDLAGAALAQGNLGELRTNQGRLDEAVAILAPARRTLESFGYPVMSAGTAMQLGRARAFLGDLEGGLDMMHAALTTFDEIGSHFESLEARARLAEVLAFSGRFPEAGDQLAKARVLEREVGETPFTAVIERVTLALAASSGEEGAVVDALDDFLDLARRVGATYEELVVLVLMERLGHRTHREDAARLTRDLGVVRLPMFPA